MRSSSISALRVVDFAEFLLNGLHLLAQKILALVLADLLLNLLVDLAAEFEHFHFLGEFADQRFQALAHIGSLDQLLAQQRGQTGQGAGDEVGQTAGIVNVQCRRFADRRRAAANG